MGLLNNHQQILSFGIIQDVGSRPKERGGKERKGSLLRAAGYAFASKFAAQVLATDSCGKHTGTGAALATSSLKEKKLKGKEISILFRVPVSKNEIGYIDLI